MKWKSQAKRSQRRHSYDRVGHTHGEKSPRKYCYWIFYSFACRLISLITRNTINLVHVHAPCTSPESHTVVFRHMQTEKERKSSHKLRKKFLRTRWELKFLTFMTHFLFSSMHFLISCIFVCDGRLRRRRWRRSRARISPTFIHRMFISVFSTLIIFHSDFSPAVRVRNRPNGATLLAKRESNEEKCIFWFVQERAVQRIWMHMRVFGNESN